MVRLEAGKAYTAPADGYFVTDKWMSDTLRNWFEAETLARELQEQLNAVPKANNDTFRYIIPADSGQNPDDSARLSGPMANSPDNDYHDPQPRHQAETVGKQELSSRVLPVARGADLHDLDSRVGFPSGPG